MMTNEVVNGLEDIGYKQDFIELFKEESIEEFIEHNRVRPWNFAEYDDFFAVGYRDSLVFKVEKESLVISDFVYVYEINTMISLPEYIIIEGHEKIKVVNTKDFSIVKSVNTR